MMTQLICVLTLLLLTISQVEAEADSLQRETSVAFLEGPAWRSDGTVFFTDIPNDRIMRWKKGGGLKLHRTPAGHANGVIFDSQDRMIIAETDGRLVRENLDGTIEVLAEKYNNKPFNSLNDLAMDSAGRIYFTDPAYGNRKNATQRGANGEIIDGVYRLDEGGKLSRVLTNEVERPNGILVSPKDQYLYVADNNGQSADGARKLWRFDLDKSGNVLTSSQKQIFDWGTDRGPDGMAIDSLGNVYVAAGINHPRPNKTSLVYKAGIYVISPQGDLLDFIAVPIDIVSNVTFGGVNAKTLYITAGHDLWSYSVDTPGYIPFNK